MTTSSVVTLVLAIIGLQPILWLWSLANNWRSARNSGLPYVVAPVNPDNLIYLIIKVPLRPLLEKILPKAAFDIIHLTIFGWEFRSKHEAHARHGAVFLLVTPGENELWVADPAVAHVVLTRRKDFIVLPIVKLVMGILGENVLTNNGESWARQRRIIAPNLNERIMETVWAESFQQSGEMVDYFSKQTSTNETVNGLRSVAINVLGQAGYGQSQTWNVEGIPVAQDGKWTYFGAISVIIDYITVSAFVNSRLMRAFFMPKAVQKIGVAMQQAPIKADEMLEKERSHFASGSETKDNMMSMLVRLGVQGDPGKESGAASSQYMTDDEIRGNLFIFTAAGFDTTANTMVYAVALLAAYPEWQLWLTEQLDEILGDTVVDEVEYASVYPKLTRCLALMYETLRLFTPILHISRAVEQTQTITTGSRSFHVPVGTKIYINAVALAHDPSTWGPDFLEFKPTRWLTRSETGSETLIPPARCTFLPWSGGPRGCPGQKMSQVEFTAVFARAFHKCRVEPVIKSGESREQMLKRLEGLMQDSQTRLTLQMNNPAGLEVKWISRKLASRRQT